jgi:hypothetical protein
LLFGYALEILASEVKLVATFAVLLSKLPTADSAAAAASCKIYIVMLSHPSSRKGFINLSAPLIYGVALS